MSKTQQILKACDRATLEAVAFNAIALLRGIGKGEVPVPPKNMDRTVLCISLVKAAKGETEAAKVIPPAPVFNDEVEDVSEAMNLLSAIAKKAGGKEAQ